jgi:hypothetical protein
MTGPTLWFGLAIAGVAGGAIGLYFHVYLAIAASLVASAAFGVLNLHFGLLTAFRDAGIAAWLVQAGFLGAIALQAWGPRESALIIASRGSTDGRAARGRR